MSLNLNVGSMKVYVFQWKQWIMINFGVSVKLDEWDSFKDDYMWYPSTCDCGCNKTCKTDEYLDTENCLCKDVSLIN